jgi:hypothetical protein
VLHLSRNKNKTLWLKKPKKKTLSGQEMYVELNSEKPWDNSIGSLETMRSIKEELQSIKLDNKKLLKTSRKQEELNEILLKNMKKIKHNKNVGQTSNNAKK